MYQFSILCNSYIINKFISHGLLLVLTTSKTSELLSSTALGDFPASKTRKIERLGPLTIILLYEGSIFFVKPFWK
jgi:hypothetical protein